MGTSQQLRFDPRFLESHTGESILKNPITALVELVANAWDAGARTVRVSWPADNEEPLIVSDDGCGMTEDELIRRWNTLAYNRLVEQGGFAEFPPGISMPRRVAFGRNGIGRFAGFCFNDRYTVETAKSGQLVEYEVLRKEEIPFVLKRARTGKAKHPGTIITVECKSGPKFAQNFVRAELGKRFLIDPNFQVYVNDRRIDFTDIPRESIAREVINCPQAGEIHVTVIDSGEADRTTRQHGIAWHVSGRLVGTCSWTGSRHASLVDGRRPEAKRLTFIVQADGLISEIKKDWTGFKRMSVAASQAKEEVDKLVARYLEKVTRTRRSQTLRLIKETHRTKLNLLTPMRVSMWSDFVSQVQRACPSMAEKDLVELAGVLATLESSNSKYALLEDLHACDAKDMDALHGILQEWTVRTAKIVLDEIQVRLRLLDELTRKVEDEDTDEVKELQPLFHKGLWIFGPQFETIEFTSNRGMTRVIQDLFGGLGAGSLNRPDFVILPDSSIGLYSYPLYDHQSGGEIGVARLVVIELKRPGVKVGAKEKDQAWKYVKELYSKGLLTDSSQVTCFVLGSEIDSDEGSERTEKGGNVSIMPLPYSVVIQRAKSRLLKLDDRVREAPFLQEAAEDGVVGGDREELELPLGS